MNRVIQSINGVDIVEKKGLSLRTEISNHETIDIIASTDDGCHSNCILKILMSDGSILRPILSPDFIKASGIAVNGLDKIKLKGVIE